MKIVNSYDEKNMTFDKEREMFILKTEYVKNEFDNPFRDDRTLEKRIIKTSKLVYGYIHKVGNSNNREIVDFLLNKTEDGRKVIFDALSAQIEADLSNGINSIVDIPRINIKTGQVIDKAAMADGYLAQSTLDVLEASTSRIKLNILYQGVYPQYVWTVFRGLLK